MKLKFLQTVAFASHIRKVGSTHEIPDKEATAMIERKFAEKFSEPKPEENATAELAAQFAGKSKKDLLLIKADAEAALAKEPGRKDAQNVIQLLTKLIAEK